jgi:hypothetical protein
MPLIKNVRNIEDARFVKQLDLLEHSNQFIREVARVVLSERVGFESVWNIANRVYDRHCSAESEPLSRFYPETTALSA